MQTFTIEINDTTAERNNIDALADFVAGRYTIGDLAHSISAESTVKVTVSSDEPGEAAVCREMTSDEFANLINQ